MRIPTDLLVRLTLILPFHLHPKLILHSLIGIWYQTRITPIKGSTKHNTRTGLGPFADRLGALAYALTPFTILLSNRESVLSLVTGIPYQHFNFLHCWLGRIIFAQSLLHTIGWTIVEAKLYQPQPSVYVGFMSSQYIIFGVVAMFLITLMLVLSTETAIRWFGYEFFKVTHWIIAVLYIGACWGHWDKLWCWMVPSLALMLIDQVARGCRTLYLHLGGRKGECTNYSPEILRMILTTHPAAGFKCAEARIQILGPPDDQVIRLDFTHSHHAPWQPGQHFHLCFPSLSIWQSHPFTPSSLPNPSSKLQHHTYLVRVRKGQTAQLAALGHGATVPVILTGPYGAALPSYGAQNVLAVAGGTGVTFTLPIVLETLRQQVGKRFAIDFVWAVRRARDLAWLEKEVDELKAAVNEHANLRVKIFVTRERVLSAVVNNTDEKAVTSTLKEMESASSGTSSMSSEKSTQSRFSIASLGDHHPSVQEHLADFMERASICGGAVEIVGSGPEAMGSDLRAAAAAVDTREMFDCYWDSRD